MIRNKTEMTDSRMTIGSFYMDSLWNNDTESVKKKKSLSNKILTKMLPNVPLGTVCVFK